MRRWRYVYWMEGNSLMVTFEDTLWGKICRRFNIPNRKAAKFTENLKPVGFLTEEDRNE